MTVWYFERGGLKRAGGHSPSKDGTIGEGKEARLEDKGEMGGGGGGGLKRRRQKIGVGE